MQRLVREASEYQARLARGTTYQAFSNFYVRVSLAGIEPVGSVLRVICVAIKQLYNRGLIDQAINQQERNNNSWYAAAEPNQFEPTHSRNQTRFPVNWLRTPTVRLNLDLALPH